MKNTILKHSLLAITCIIAAFFLSLYAINITIIRSYTEKDVVSQIQSRQKLQADMHSLLYQGIKKNITTLLTSKNVFLLGDKKPSNTLTSAEIELLYEIMSEMSAAKITDDKIKSIYVHFLNSGIVLSTEHYWQNSTDFYDRDWINISGSIATSSEPKFVGGVVDYDNEYIHWHYKCARYIFEHMSYIPDEKVLIVVNYDTDVLDKILSSDSHNSVMMLNSSLDEFHASVKDKETEQFINQNMSQIISGAVAKNNFILEGKYLISVVKDEYDNLLLNIFNYKNLISTYDNLLSIFLVLACILTLITTVIWYIITLRLYSPVNKAIHDIMKLSESLKLGNPDDNYMIDKAVNRLISRLKNTEALKMETKFFDNVLLKRNVDDSFGYLTKSSYCGIRVLIDQNAENSVCNHTEELITEVIYEVLEKNMIQSVGRVVSSGVFDILVSFDLEKTEDESEFTHSGIQPHVFENMATKIKTITEHTVTIGVGDTYNNIRYLSMSLDEAEHRASRRLLLGVGKIITESEEATHQLLRDTDFTTVIEAVKNENYENIKEAFCILKNNALCKKYEISVENVPIVTNYLVFSIFQHFMPAILNGAVIQEIINTLNSLETFYEMLDYICERTLELLDQKKSMVSLEMDIIQKASRFIHENYTKDIDVNTLAENIDVSYSKLRRIMIKELGVNIVDYINSLRIKKAKELLEQTENTLNDIALKIGYNNEQSFTRYFKKFEDCTPGEYRKNLHK